MAEPKRASLRIKQFKHCLCSVFNNPTCIFGEGGKEFLQEKKIASWLFAAQVIEQNNDIKKKQQQQQKTPQCLFLFNNDKFCSAVEQHSGSSGLSEELNCT